ncbi:LysR substrate-binding domain-containing protein [Thalassospira marina]|uniref:LysR family transcriptional regulator n=1 Tax=Thalassospira marina TaxID=2048283 RepID=A0ABM6QB83_9PROT|nr:LysR substrate-binding domain-containing protein [Thalassospira marina]AUG53805.1 LysR family transcriptional regulator [Thalassospira marina]
MINSIDLQFFMVIARASSLAAAARLLNVTPPAVTQRLAALEARLGVNLIDRRGRHLTLTDEGELLLERSERILAELGDITDRINDRRGLIAGHLRIAAPIGFGREYIAPAVRTFKHAHPDISVSLDLSDNPIGQQPENRDVIIHIGELRNQPFQMQHIAPNRRILCAAPAYIARFGPPATITDLAHHQCLILRENDEDVSLWRFHAAAKPKTKETVRVNGDMTSNDGNVIRDWALAGMGIALRSEWDVAQHIRKGRLVEILPDWQVDDAPIVALLGPRHFRAARIRHFINHLRTCLTPVPWNAMP